MLGKFVPETAKIKFSQTVNILYLVFPTAYTIENV